jgi:phosphonate transport system substrate-binding protein
VEDAAMRHIFRMCLIIVFVLGLATAATAQSRLAVYPMTDPQKLLPPMRVLAEYLNERTGETITPIITRDYNEMILRLEDRTVDIAWLNPVTYLKLKERLPNLQYIATYMEFNQDAGKVIPYYHSYVITLKAGPVTEISQARDQRMAFTDVGSTSGYAYPAMMLRSQGIEPETFFRNVFFLKRHDRVIKALVTGSIDLGAVSDGTYYNAVQNHGDIFRILLKSDPIPLDAIVSPGQITPERAAMYREALAAMPLDHPFNTVMKEMLGWPAAGFAVLNDSLYDGFRKALQ